MNPFIAQLGKVFQVPAGTLAAISVVSIAGGWWLNEAVGDLSTADVTIREYVDQGLAAAANEAAGLFNLIGWMGDDLNRVRSQGGDHSAALLVLGEKVSAYTAQVNVLWNMEFPPVE